MGQRAGSALRYLPALTVGLFLGPVIAGLIGTLLPAFGYLPALGGEQFSLEPWRRLLHHFYEPFPLVEHYGEPI